MSEGRGYIILSMYGHQYFISLLFSNTVESELGESEWAD